MDPATANNDVKHLTEMVLGQLHNQETQNQKSPCIAIDCEMVGIGPKGKQSSLARVSLVNYHGEVILDTFVRQAEETPVEDYRTPVSGIRPEDLTGPAARPFAEVKSAVKKLLKKTVLVGHTLQRDLKVLHIWHDDALKVDVQGFPEWKVKYPEMKIPGLKFLVRNELGIDIQGGEHDSVTDARAALALYRLHTAQSLALSPALRRIQKHQKKASVGSAATSTDSTAPPPQVQEQPVSKAKPPQKRKPKKTASVQTKTKTLEISKVGLQVEAASDQA